VYCVDGCNWKSTASDYESYPPWPSAARAVLDYFEDEAHSELDMIRDEFPGTAAGLTAACDEHIGHALSRYPDLDDEEKVKMHEDMMKELSEAVASNKAELDHAYETYKEVKSAFADFKKNPRKRKSARTRVEELEREMEPLQMELDVERAATRCDALKKTKAEVVRLLNREKQFSL
jgi:hypothetical protein